MVRFSAGAVPGAWYRVLASSSPLHVPALWVSFPKYLFRYAVDDAVRRQANDVERCTQLGDLLADAPRGDVTEAVVARVEPEPVGYDEGDALRLNLTGVPVEQRAVLIFGAIVFLRTTCPTQF